MLSNRYILPYELRVEVFRLRYSYNLRSSCSSTHHITSWNKRHCREWTAVPCDKQLRRIKKIRWTIARSRTAHRVQDTSASAHNAAAIHPSIYCTSYRPQSYEYCMHTSRFERTLALTVCLSRCLCGTLFLYRTWQRRQHIYTKIYENIRTI